MPLKIGRSTLVPLFGLLLLTGAALLGARLAHASAPYDDAFITLRYARNFAEGRGFVYNSGESVLGTSSPFYGLLLGALSRVTGVDPLAFANWFSALSLAVAGWYACRLVLEDFDPLSAVVAGVSVTINPMLVSAWGGEWLVAIAAMAAAFYYYRVDRTVIACIALSVAVLLRAEAILGAALVIAHALLTRRAGVLRALALSAALGALWLAIAWLVIGRVMPTTLATKMTLGRLGLLFTFLEGSRVVARQFISADKWTLTMLLLAWHGALYAIVKRGVWLLIGLWVVAHVAFYVWLGLAFYHWYLVPIAFGLSVAAGAGLAAVRVYVPLVVRAESVARALSAAIMLALSAALLMAEWRSTRYWVSIKPEPREALYNRVGSWLAANTAPDASVAYLEIGRIGYYSMRRIIDQMGLVTPGLAPKIEKRDFLWSIYRDKPDYYLVCPLFDWAGSLGDEPWFHSVYQQAAVLPATDGSMTLLVFRKQPGAKMPAALDMEPIQVQDGAVVGEIVSGTSHSQTFVASRPRLGGVATRLATFARVNHGPMRFTAEQIEPYRLVSREDFDMAAVKNNSWRVFRFPAVEDSEGKRFKFTLEAVNASPGNAITIWYSVKNLYPAGEHLVNGQPAPGDLTVRLMYDNNPR